MIFGIFSPDQPLIRRTLARAGAGWPGGSFYAGKNIGLRSDSGKAGLFEDAGGASLVAYSGELYNYAELRSELEASGVKFRSGLESELVLRAYGLWGAGCQAKFNGAWAFAVWDGGKRELFCSRDRFGLRPFYYFYDGAAFVFASRLTALFACPAIKKEPDSRAVFDYLALNRSEFPDRTFFKGLKPLEAGCSLRLAPGRGPEAGKYYTPGYNPELGEFDGKAFKTHCSEFRGILESSVKARLASPLPAGISLSGGLDSSAICCLADRAGGGKGPGGGRLKTVSLAWPGEAPHIKQVSEAVNSDHFEISPEEAGGLTWREMERRARASEIPLTSTSEIGRMLVERAAGRQQVKVLLDGCGGDELLAGYPGRYFNVYLNQVILGGDIPRFDREFRKLFSGRLREFGITGKMHPEFYKSFLKTQASGAQLSGFFAEETLDRDFFREQARSVGPAPRLRLNLQQALWTDTLDLGKECNPLGKITYRFPYLDHRVVDYVFSLPACYKIHNGWTKYLVRMAMSGILPKGVRWRKEKIGGMAPASAWKGFMTRNRGRLNGLLTGRKFYSEAFVNQKAVAKRLDALFETAVSPSTMDISGLWRFANLELWLSENMR